MPFTLGGIPFINPRCQGPSANNWPVPSAVISETQSWKFFCLELWKKTATKNMENHGHLKRGTGQGISVRKGGSAREGPLSRIQADVRSSQVSGLLSIQSGKVAVKNDCLPHSTYMRTGVCQENFSQL